MRFVPFASSAVGLLRFASLCVITKLHKFRLAVGLEACQVRYNVQSDAEPSAANGKECNGL